MKALLPSRVTRGLQPLFSREPFVSLREEMDDLARFISDCCVLESGSQVQSSDLFREYQQWYRDGNLSNTWHVRPDLRQIVAGVTGSP